MPTPKRPNQVPQSEAIDIKELVGQFLSKWYWFVISVAVCVSFAAYKVMKTTPMYARTITVMFKTEPTKDGTKTSIDLSDLGIKTHNTDIANEMITIRSIDMMAEVVEALDLNNAYFVKSGLHRKILYKTSPILVQNMAPADKQLQAGYGFKVTMKSATQYVLSDFTGPGVDPKLKLTAEVGRTIKTPVGPMKITTTQAFSKDYIGVPVQYVHYTPEGMGASIAAALTFKLTEYSKNIVDLTIVDESAERATDILNTLIEIYSQHWIVETNQAAANTSSFINERLKVIEEELGDVESHISSYKSANLITGSADQTGEALGRLKRSQEEKAQLNNRISLVKYLRREVQNASLETPLPNPAGIEGTTVEGQIGQYNNLVMERNRMLANSSESNPLVQERTKTLETLRTLMVQAIDNLLLVLNTNMHTIEVAEAKSTSDLVRSPSQARYLLSVERQQKVKESLYLFLLQKREENELAQSFSANNTRIINAPRGSNAPVVPQGNSSLLMAFVIGLGIPLVVIFLMKNLDTKIHSRRDLAKLRLPFLGEIPFTGKRPSFFDKFRSKPTKATPSMRPILVKPQSRNAINEAFRVVRSNFDMIGGTFGTATDDVKVVMVTSMYPDSGKTFFALNFAATLAMKGKKVVLIDLDMRKGTVSHLAGPGRKGISNFVAGQASISDIIATDINGTPGLDLIPVGAIPPNPSEMLYSPRFEELIEELKEQYAYVIIDCPPVEIVADTQIINRLVDMTIFVVRAGLFDKKDTSKLNEFYDEKRFKNLAVILNGVDARRGYYGGRKYSNTYAGYIHRDKD
ncbi:MAG: polysaccharide biosynthesis tyrosine autokinase [Candidatus Amulumruptor caecigallinarius]|nr:polysaccharide biosynthesis tyrosine autokinase [Candidatus Amulumruptor caecigallinarius]MCM1396412.1 polysaccharide biosynthesis tyrosine autokinase [Candidatus Amulumruptor caecigallinarius]MCM1453531.1 polysaccharide biosynthesis tyrosine autokinase [bacterium]